jgi:Domain of unknown function (DUF2760)
MDANLTPLQRLFLAFVAFFLVLFDRRFAVEVKQVRERQRAALPPGGSSRQGSGAAEAVSVRVPPSAPPPVEKPRPVAAPVPVPEPPPAPAPRAPPVPAGPAPDAVALHVLAMLQRDGRLIDFLSEDLNGFSDSEIGAAARTVHAGCRKTLGYVQLEPVYRDPEGASVTVPPGFDPAAVRLTGNVVGNPPFKGSLRHHGWRATRATFPPPPAHDPHILAPAEVEL